MVAKSGIYFISVCNLKPITYSVEYDNIFKKFGLNF